MKKVSVLVAVVMIAILVYTLRHQPSTTNALAQSRQEKDTWMKTSPDSPFYGDASFSGLNYFDADDAYRVEADVKIFPIQETLLLPSNDGSMTPYKKWGEVLFTLHDVPCRLTILESVAERTLFIPFTDETSGNETYGGGRYLNLSKPNNNKLTLNFNEACNPYCAYNHQYVCALPPKENQLPIKILAGEKKYRE